MSEKTKENYASTEIWSDSINNLAEEIMSWRIGKGFFTPNGITTEHDRDMMLGKLMLVVTEVSEAAEAVRHNDMKNLEEEIADTFIRLFDIASTCEMDIHKIIADKMEINVSRPIKHGKFTSL